MIDMRKQDEERIAIELDQLGISYKLNEMEFYDDEYLGCEKIVKVPKTVE